MKPAIEDPASLPLTFFALSEKSGIVVLSVINAHAH